MRLNQGATGTGCSTTPGSAAPAGSMTTEVGDAPFMHASNTALRAQWFKSSLPETINLKANWQQSFGEIYDKLVRIDKRNPDQIREVSRWARTDSFWQSNFLSPSKLRDRNPSGIQYFDVFTEKMKETPNKKTAVNIGGRHAGSDQYKKGSKIFIFYTFIKRRDYR